MSVIDFKTRIEEPSYVAELEHENEYLRSQLRAARTPRRRHPMSVILGIWFVAGFCLLDAALRLYSMLPL